MLDLGDISPEKLPAALKLDADTATDAAFEARRVSPVEISSLADGSTTEIGEKAKREVERGVVRTILGPRGSQQ